MDQVQFDVIGLGLKNASKLNVLYFSVRFFFFDVDFSDFSIDLKSPAIKFIYILLYVKHV